MQDPAKAPSGLTLTKLLWTVALIVVAVILMALVWVNRHTTTVDLLLWEMQIRVFILVPLIFLLGFLAGWGFKTLVTPKRRRESSP